MKTKLHLILALAFAFSLPITHLQAAPSGKEINTPEKAGTYVTLKVAASTHLYAGNLVSVNSSGYAIAAVDTASTICIGKAEETVDNSSGSNGDLSIRVKQGVFHYANNESLPVLTSTVGQLCYVTDDHTVGVSSSNSIVAGRVLSLDSTGVWINTLYYYTTVGTVADGAVTVNKIGASAVTTAKINDAAVTGAKLSTAGQTRTIVIPLGTIATTGSTKVTIPAPQDATLTAAKICGKDALATSDSNYLTFSLTNKGQAGGGSTAMLSATASGTTKATGGAAIAAYTTRDLPLHATAGNAALTAGDCLELSVAATGTLANTVTETTITLSFTFAN